MKYQCKACGETFYHAELRTVNEPFDTVLGIPEAPYPHRSRVTHVCPFCDSLKFDEIIEAEDQVESVIKVKIAEADSFIKQGYQPKEYYAHEVTMIKRKETATT